MAGKRVLLVEGLDDKHVFHAIFAQRGLQPIDDIKEHGGKENLLEAFPVRLKESDIEGLGIVVDADRDCKASWEAVRGRLIDSAYAAPEKPIPAGTIIEPPANSLLPRVGVWMMPDNNAGGILEDFLRFLIPQGNVLHAHAASSISAIPADSRLFSETDAPKALIHTWLAWQTRPGRPLGQSITARFLDSHLPAADQLVAWLRTLFYL